jgi:3-hydroxymyristoyl/3-hydroxydecanoyl-(acyl carrier protein) dehydratase
MRFLFVDRILQLIPGKSIQGIKQITRDDACLCLDEQGQLAFIPSFIGETLGQLAAWNVMSTNEFTLRPVAGIVNSARLHRSALVGETLFLESFIDQLDDNAVEYHSQAWVGDEKVFSIEGALGPLLPMNDFIADHCVRQQFAEIYRPGEIPTLDPVIPTEYIKTPTPPLPHLAFDRIIHSQVGEALVAEKYITGAAPWFRDHFPLKPVLPMTVLLECKINLAREFIRRAQFSVPYQLKELRKIKMNDFVQPGDILRCTLKIKTQNENELILHFRSEVDGKRVCVLDMVMSN